MTQGHNPDYDALMHQPHGTALAHVPHPQHPQAVHPMAPQQHVAMVPAHEVQQVHNALHAVRGELAQIREHQQRQPPMHAPPMPSHHESRYADHDDRERRERSDRREHRHQHNEPDYGGPRRARQRPAPGPLKLREFPVGFIQAAVPAGANAEIEVKPQVRFQGHRLGGCRELRRATSTSSTSRSERTASSRRRARCRPRPSLRSPSGRRWSSTARRRAS